jgi:hypothetical protein
MAEFAETMAAGIAELIQALFGPALANPVYQRLTWAHVAAAVLLLALVLMFHGLVAVVLRRRLKAAAAGGKATVGESLLLGSVAKLLYLILWLFGLYLAITPLLVNVATAEQLDQVHQWLNRVFGLGAFLGVLWLLSYLTRVLEGRIRLAANNSDKRTPLLPLLEKSLRVVILVVGVILALPLIGLPPAYSGVIGKTSSLLIIGAVAWILFQGVETIEKWILGRFDLTAVDNLQARKIHTQVNVLSKTLYVLIAILTVASALMLFEDVRRFGASILASAGVLGIIIGFAAQRTIANLFAGFQLAMTQPIRIDDVVIVEQEWGRIEEITLTYVVVRIWDERRLIVPLSHFIEKPFQNWTRTSAELLGSVFLWVDYSLPLEQVRPAVQRIVENSPSWDRRFWNLQITDATDRAMQLRVLATSADSSKGWDLRCEIREKLILFVQQNYPGSLPKFRAELTRETAGAARDSSP